MDGDDVRRRLPSVPRKIAGIAQGDVRVSVIGTVLDASESSIVLDDGTGKMNISLGSASALKTGQLVRVLGRVMPMEGGAELQGEIAQDMEGLDLELRRRAEKVLS